MILPGTSLAFSISKYRNVLLLTLLWLSGCASEPEATWHLVNVNASQLQGDANLIQTSNLVIMIDGGRYSEAEKSLVPYLSLIHISEPTRPY